ncbi:putative E3 ubiquitin-protein ligase DTX3 [Channa argus]|uniref:E3 ubiquitin-protein ligase n=1 Tax=Channa argus TaxID=215402 RepID=A0A6G1Q2J7_CHAAH|nr:putative E3 ubiquitin-protein ligase DTX3 [Channa argus]
MENKQSCAEDCAICLDKIQKMKTLKCLHSFCSDCIDSLFTYKPACPICNTYHGVYTGNQPAGTMTVTRSSQRLPVLSTAGPSSFSTVSQPGYKGQYTTTSPLSIRAPLDSCHRYNRSPGKPGQPKHPNPGVGYRGTCRIVFLPACEEGEKVLKLLRKAFDRRLIFTVGRYATTAQDNVIPWNDIHHKTSMGGGPQWYAYYCYSEELLH